MASRLVEDLDLRVVSHHGSGREQQTILSHVHGTPDAPAAKEHAWIVADLLDAAAAVAAVSGTRKIRKADMKLNDYQPNIEVDSQTYEVRADGQLLTCEPADVLPLAQKYFLF